jgi:uncharacterized protein YqfA (UPF0365 family)
MPPVYIWVPLLVLLAPLLAVGVVFAMFFGLWLRAKAAGMPVSVFTLAMARLRGLNPEFLIDCLITLWNAGLEVDLDDLEAHVLCGGHLGAVVDAAISADKAGLDVTFRHLAAIDLAGRDVVDAVNTRVNPKVLVCPPQDVGHGTISGVARDGIRLEAKARVTIRTNLERLVGGAGEETVIARVGEGIVTAIGRADSHREILERPELISDCVLARGLDSGTCFEILSVDIADVDVVDNVSARLKSSQAEADKRIAQAKAEIRRAAAVAVHQEMKARTTESESRVKAARSTVPLGVAAAFEEANLGRHRPLPHSVNPRMRWQARV